MKVTFFYLAPKAPLVDLEGWVIHNTPVEDALALQTPSLACEALAP